MKLTEIVNKIKGYCSVQYIRPNIMVGDVYKNLNTNEITYPVVNIDLNNVVKNGVDMVYSFYIYYADRLDESSSNELGCQSDAISFLQMLIGKIDMDEDVHIDNSTSISVFEQKFADLCAGGWMLVNIHTLNDIDYCDEGYKPVWNGLKFKCGDVDSAVAMTKWGGYSGDYPDIKYSLDDGHSWIQWDGSEVDLNAGDEMWLKGTNYDEASGTYYFGKSPTESFGFVMSGEIYASGYITSLLNGDELFYYMLDYEYPRINVHSHTFYYLFRYCSALITAPFIPMKKGEYGKYVGMAIYQDCINLTYAKVEHVDSNGYAWFLWGANPVNGGTLEVHTIEKSDLLRIPSTWEIVYY